MDEEQLVFEQLTLSDFNKWSSTVLKAHTKFLETESPLKIMKNAFHFK